MSARPDLPPALRALLEAGWAIASKSTAAQTAIGRLDGVVIADALPALVRDDVSAVIARARERSATPIAVKDVEKLLKDAWGEAPSKLLGGLDPEPIAVLPHAQVHRGDRDGAAVAIKVARPGVASATRSDLALLDTLAAPARSAFPAIDPAAFIREIRERTLDELDLEHEAEAHRRAARALRKLDGVSAPAVDRELTTASVLVSEFVEGSSLADGLPAGADAGAIARRLVKVYAGAPRAIAAVIANPRANDVIVRPDGEVVLLGLGSQRAVDPARLELAIAALAAFRDADADAFAAATVAAGALADGPARAAFALMHELAGDLTGTAFRLDPPLLADRGEDALERFADLFAILIEATPAPADLWPGRSLAQAIPVLARLEATEDWGALALDALESGWG